MNPHLTEIAYILDRSGSMGLMQQAAITGFNQFVNSQLDVPGEARLTLVQFDDCYEVHAQALPIEQVSQLDNLSYVPRGSTALLDAIGRTILETHARIQTLPADQQPAKVVIAVFTDGQENASRTHSALQISEMIRIHREQHGWEFLFLAANQDAIAAAGKLNINVGNSGNVRFNEPSILASSIAMSRKIRSMRMRSSNTMDERSVADENKTLDQMIREEESRLPSEGADADTDA